MPIDPRISLRKLEILSLVVELGGIGKAAEHLYVAQPVVTSHVRMLEERLGTKIFYREGRQMLLTDAGHAVHEWADEVLTRTRELERHLEALSQGTEGSIAFGASMSIGSYVLPHVLTSFRQGHPRAAVRLGISDTEHVLEDTRDGVFDFGVVVAEADLSLPDMTTRQIATDEIVFVAALDGPDYPAHVDVAQLAGFPFIDAPTGIIRRTFIDQRLRQFGIQERNVVLELGHPEAMKRAARDRLGVAVMFRTAADEDLRRGDLREIVVTGMNVQVPVYLAHRSSKSFSNLHRELIEMIELAIGS